MPKQVVFFFVIRVHFRYRSPGQVLARFVCIFLPDGKKNYGVAAIELSASDAHPRRILFSSPVSSKKKDHPMGGLSFLVETGGLEPSTSCV